MANQSDQITFSIYEVAEQIGVVPATIRNWEKQGLFTSQRAANGYRIFDFHDIEYLKRIKQYSKDENMGINAIRLLVQQHGGLYEARDRGGGLSRDLLSRKWKECRTERGYNLEEVAAGVGISPSYLSKIENGQANVSLNVLHKLADFYGENLLYYLDDAAQESHLVKEGEGRPVNDGRAGVDIYSLVALRDFRLSIMKYIVQPGSGNAESSTHSGQEYVYVLEGQLRYTLNNEVEYILNKGDSLSYRSSEPHRWFNASDEIAEILWVYTPAGTGK